MNLEDEKAKLAMLIKKSQEEFSPLLCKEAYTQLAKEYKVKYDCYRGAGFSVKEALRLTVGYYD
jgi:hypothetical protein